MFTGHISGYCIHISQFDGSYIVVPTVYVYAFLFVLTIFHHHPSLKTEVNGEAFGKYF